MATFLVVLRRSGPRWDPSRPLEEQSDWPAHASFMDALVDAGFIILGGPLADDERVAHAVEAESEDAVRATLARDPWSQTHLRIETIEPWTIRLDARHTAHMDVRSDGESRTTAELAGTDWRVHGVRVVRAGDLDMKTPQTPGMNRAAAITTARAGAEKLWAGTVMIHPDAKTGAHHHGPLESVIYVVSGRARMRWGERLEFTAEAGPGDFIYVPPFVPHQEINASPDAPLSCVVVRSGQEPVVVNLDLPEVESNPQRVDWVDDIHPQP